MLLHLKRCYWQRAFALQTVLLGGGGAAHTVSPILGQGLSCGLGDSLASTRNVANHMRGHAVNHEMPPLQTVLLGDAAHTMSPILGQGLNCGLEDVQVLANLLQQHQGNLDQALPAYNTARWPDGEAMLNINEIVARSNYTLTTKVVQVVLHCIILKVDVKKHDPSP